MATALFQSFLLFLLASVVTAWARRVLLEEFDVAEDITNVLYTAARVFGILSIVSAFSWVLFLAGMLFWSMR